MSTFPQYLKMHRTQMGLSLKQVSEALDISENLLYQYETNKSFPSGKNLIKLARFYHFSLDQLFDNVLFDPTIPPLYNCLGEKITFKNFPWPQDANYYQLSSKQIVLVKTCHQYRNNQSVLAFFHGKIEIFYLTFYNNCFFLINKSGQLFSYTDDKIKIIGPIIQYITIVEE